MAKKQTTKTAGRARNASKKGAAANTRTTPATRARDPRTPAPGTTITRTFKGRELRLTVLDEGFRFEGTVYRSLTAAALRATGYPAVSGPRFWKTDEHVATTPKRAAKRGRTAETMDDATQPATAADTATA